MTYDDPQVLGEEQKAFLGTPLGQYVGEKVGQLYSDLHKEAESGDLTSEQKAFKIERAAGVQLVIDILTANAILLDSGTFERPKDASTT